MVFVAAKRVDVIQTVIYECPGNETKAGGPYRVDSSEMDKGNHEQILDSRAYGADTGELNEFLKQGHRDRFLLSILVLGAMAKSKISPNRARHKQGSWQMSFDPPVKLFSFKVALQGLPASDYA